MTLAERIDQAPGTPFQKQVWHLLTTILPGETMSYQQVAVALGKPTAYRAVANACGANPFPIEIPCHRVIASNGSLGGYSCAGGIKRKQALLMQEQPITP